MRNRAKYILSFLLSFLFIWMGSGANYAVYHCLDCHSQKNIQIDSHSHDACCADEQQCCSHSNTSHNCHGDEDENLKKSVTGNREASGHHHHGDHCIYVIKYTLDLQKSFSEISIPSVKLFKSDLFSLFIPQEEENNSNNYTSFIPIRYSTNTFLSTLCVFII